MNTRSFPACDLKPGDRLADGTVVVDAQPCATSLHGRHTRVTVRERSGIHRTFPIDSTEPMEVIDGPDLLATLRQREEAVAAAVETLEFEIRLHRWEAEDAGGGSTTELALRRAAELQQVLDVVLALDAEVK
jgi:hypothetical protein